jgi:hypothetical protein
MLLSGQTTTEQQASALQGRFAFSIAEATDAEPRKIRLDIFFLRFEFAIGAARSLTVWLIKPTKGLLSGAPPTLGQDRERLITITGT